MKRRTVLLNNREFVQNYDNRSIDELCKSNQDQMELQVQQKFLQKFIRDNSEIPQLLLYHQIGSGKTITSIVMAEEHMLINPRMKVLVILPARLKSNFINELMLFDKYITRAEYSIYMNINTSKKIRSEIFKRYLNKVDKNYTIISFERFRIDTMKNANPKEYLQKLVKNKVVIIDEMHNLISHIYDAKQLKSLQDGIKPKKKIISVNTLLLHIMTRYAPSSTRFIYLTATPVFDNVRQFAELVKVMNPGVAIKKNINIAELISYLKGKVSYFPGSSPNAYPTVSYIDNNITPTKFQIDMLKYVRPFMFPDPEAEEDEDPSNAFVSLERRASTLAYIGDYKEKGTNRPIIEDEEAPEEYKYTFKETKELAMINPERYMPKIYELEKEIENNPGKHLVYSSFIEYGGELIADYLKLKGWIDIKDVLKRGQEIPKNYKCFTTWDGMTNNDTKNAIKGLVNSYENMDGKLLRVVIGSPAMKEGVSFKHIQHYHILDPVWNQSTRTQVEGRAIRFCSHYDIPLNHPVLRRHVVVHLYKLKYPLTRIEQEAKMAYGQNAGLGGLPMISIDDYIYDYIIENKSRRVKIAERMLRKVAFDFYLFRKLYRKPEENKTTPENDIGNSNISASDDNINLLMNNKNAKEKKKKNTCMPKTRRPPCAEGFEVKLNKNKNECCYKITKKKLKELEKNKK